MNWRRVGKILFFAGVGLTILTFIWRELILNGVHVEYIVYAMDISFGFVIFGALIWLSQLGKEKLS